jgi:acyl-coenzyme A thioesterase PaaI-like protein
MVTIFSQASSARARTDDIFDAVVSSEWTVLGRPNGGYLFALLGRAASALTGSDVIAASVHYLRSPAPGPVEIEGELLRRGRSISQVRTRMSQDGRLCLEALMSMGEVASAAAPRWDGGIPDGLIVPIEDCLPLPPATPICSRAAIFEQVEARLDPGSAEFQFGRPSGRGQIRGWLKLPADECFDPVSLLYAVDALPPATLDTDCNAMVTTVELTVYIRAIPAPGPVWIASRVRLIDQQFADQVCGIWDVTGRLVAHATQLAMVPSS